MASRSSFVLNAKKASVASETDRVELLYLHSPDQNVPIEDSAGALGELLAAGKTRSVGASNCSLEQFQAFHALPTLRRATSLQHVAARH